MATLSPPEVLAARTAGLNSRPPTRTVLGPPSLPLGIPEACVLASGCGGNVTRIAAAPQTLLERLGHLGAVTMFTRNAAAGLEVRSAYGPFEGEARCSAGTTRLVLRPEAWAHALVVRGGSPARPTRTLAVFAPDGTAVHETQVPMAHVAAFDAALADLAAPDQSPELPLHRPRIRAGERRLDIVRFARGGRSWQVALWSLGPVLDRAASVGAAIAITVANEGLRHRWEGIPPAGREGGPWGIVLDDTARLLLRRDRIVQAWVARRHVVGGTATTLELFDGSGHAAVVVSAVGPCDDAPWLEVVASVPRRWAHA